MNTPKISLIMACKNEEKNIERVLVSLEKQTVKPAEVVIVDDVSTDKTCEIIKKIVNNNRNWLVYRVESDHDISFENANKGSGLHFIKKNRNERAYVSIVNALKKATELLKVDFDFLMVLDGDTVLEPQYIEKILQKFHSESRLGIAGGNIQIISSNKQYKKFFDPNYVFGCNRVYSKKCWYEINGGKILNVKTFVWDPEHSAKARGRDYAVKRYDRILSESIRLPRLGISSFSTGILRYQFGYSFWTILVSTIINANLPFLIGYLVAALRKKPKIDDDNYMEKITKEHDAEFIRRIRSRLKMKTSN